ncbi:CynX/NimT family MFS transporter [uncultured Corynebacterium sp.]|uniref:MFS transporter n=1 Tax=uncultured Corynebacterium sp. TaxID=159447 RepID=UPI0025E52025|nr:MFS transporter [uncultured Corynebacterium sp.]
MPSRSATALIVGFVLVSFNTRAPFGQVGPLAPVADLSSTVVTLLGVIPPLAMGISAPFVPHLLRRLGETRLFLVASGVALAGAVGRPFGVTGLITGTAVVSLAIGVINVLIPVYVVSRFPGRRSGPVFGAYALSMGLGSALVALVTVPVAHLTGHWETAVAVVALPALSALVGSRMMDDGVTAASSSAEPARVPSTGESAAAPRVSRTWLAWSLTAFFGVQTLLFYALMAWLPSILVSTGHSVGSAGIAQTVLIIGISLGGLLSPLIAARSRDQSRLVAVIITLCTVGLVGLALAPGLATALWVPLAGVGLGGGQAVPAVLYAHRGRDHAHTAALSSFAQSVGFLVAATGPVLLNLGHSAFGNWSTPLLILATVCIVNLSLSWRAGKPEKLTAAGGGTWRTRWSSLRKPMP